MYINNPLKSRDFMKRILSIVLFLGIAESMTGAVVGHNGKYFTVTETDRSYRVGRESLDGTLRNVNKANMAMFMKRGRISAHKTNDGSYVLRGYVNGLGGGPIAGSIAYWVTKCGLYGGAAAAGGAVIASGVGAIVTAAGGGAALAGGTAAGAAYVADVALVTAAETAGVLAGTVGSVSAGVISGGVSTVITGAGLAGAAELGTVAVVTSTAGTTLGTVGFVEGLSLGACALLTACPFLP
jgi:hypothetical protein